MIVIVLTWVLLTLIVILVNSDVGSYCDCSPGWTGYDCNTTVTCDTCTDGVCDNQGQCQCPAGYNGTYPNCTDNQDTLCFFVNITLSESLDASTIADVVSALIGIDRSQIVVEGPIDNGDGTFGYSIGFCSDQNINGQDSETTFENFLNSGQTGGLHVVPHSSTSTSASASTSTSGKGSTMNNASSFSCLFFFTAFLAIFI